MNDLKLTKTGTLNIQQDEITIDGFDAEGASCREVGVLALLWAIGELQKELTAMLEKPGGSGKCSVD